MRLTVKCFATLSGLEPKEPGLEFPEGATVRDVLNQLNIPLKEARIIFINGRGKELDAVLSEGDRLSVFPPVGGG